MILSAETITRLREYLAVVGEAALNYRDELKQDVVPERLPYCCPVF